jgi:ubiquinone/menaquinone biosynthesis C-methylase UbiE
MLSLLPESLRGMRVLDAGCAAGPVAVTLADRGAQVVGIDSSIALLELARALHVDVAFHQANLSQPMPFLEDGSFDLVFCSLTLHYIADWSVPLGEFCRVLRPRGTLLMSTHHPAMTTPMFDDYFATQLVHDTWKMGESDVRVSYYHRPLTAMFDALRDSGFEIDRVVEPRFAGTPSDEHQKRLATSPWFLIIRAIREA